MLVLVLARVLVLVLVGPRIVAPVLVAPARVVLALVRVVHARSRVLVQIRLVVLEGALRVRGHVVLRSSAR